MDPARAHTCVYMCVCTLTCAMHNPGLRTSHSQVTIMGPQGPRQNEEGMAPTQQEHESCGHPIKAKESPQHVRQPGGAHANQAEPMPARRSLCQPGRAHAAPARRSPCQQVESTPTRRSPHHHHCPATPARCCQKTSCDKQLPRPLSWLWLIYSPPGSWLAGGTSFINKIYHCNYGSCGELRTFTASWRS